MYSGRPVYSPVTALAVPHGISNPVLDLFEYSTSHGVPSMPSCGMVPYRGFLIPLDTKQRTTLKNSPRTKTNATMIVVILKPTLNAILCMVIHIARVWINRVREPILHVVS